MSSFTLRETVKKTDFSRYAATVVGYGNIGRQHVDALRALGVGQIRVCSRSAKPLNELEGVPGIITLPGDIERLECHPMPDELVIIATPTETLISTARYLASMGFRRILIEKPVSLWSEEIGVLASDFNKQGIDAICGYNRTAYPSFHEIKSRTLIEGGVTSCTYTFTELIKPDWPERYSEEELARWGVSNSLHPISMAHGLIGMPQTWECHRSGSLPWHKTGSVFVGSGVSERKIPFSYHADWSSKSRWSVEIHTSVSSYRMCPLETVVRQTDALLGWEDVEVTACYPEIKVGLAEEIAAMLNPTIRETIPLFSLAESASLTRYGEDVFGYETRLGSGS